MLARDFLRQLLLSGLLDQTFILAMDPTFSNDTTVYLQSEAQDFGADLDVSFFLSRYFDIAETVNRPTSIQNYRRTWTSTMFVCG